MGNLHFQLRERARAAKSPGMGKRRNRKRVREGERERYIERERNRKERKRAQFYSLYVRYLLALLNFFCIPFHFCLTFCLFLFLFLFFFLFFLSRTHFEMSHRYIIIIRSLLWKWMFRSFVHVRVVSSGQIGEDGTK